MYVLKEYVKVHNTRDFDAKYAIKRVLHHN